MNRLTTALLLGVSLIDSPVDAQSLPDGVDVGGDIEGAVGVGIGDDGVPGNGGGNDDSAQNHAPSAPGHDRDTDENTAFANRFGEVIELRPAPEAEQMSWYETPAANW